MMDSDRIEAELDLAERGFANGKAISLDRRLFMQFAAYTNCRELAPIIVALEGAAIEGVMYADANDPLGIGLLTASEDPGLFVHQLRTVLQSPSWAGLQRKPEYDMFGRTYSIGYEPDLEETLLNKPLRRVLDERNQWAIWYPLQRHKGFQRLPAVDQRRILAEHGTLAKRYGRGGHATDVRLACHGLDRNDNDFVIGLIGPELHPLSAIVQEMRKTEQTALHLESLGPFFVGKVLWRSRAGVSDALEIV
jgi:hypothetical protein